MKKLFYTICTLFFAFTLTGCTSFIELTANPDKSSDVKINIDLGEVLFNTMQSAFNSIAGLAEEKTNQELELFNEEDIKKTIVQGDFTNARVTVPSKTSFIIEGTLPSPSKQTSVINDNGVKIANFVNCQDKTLTLILSPETITEFIKTLPQENQDITDLFMAPVFTGEQMTGEEYMDLIESIYGAELAKELKTAVVKVSLSCPKGHKIAKSSLSKTDISKTSETKVTFNMALCDLLVLSNTKTFSINWN